MRLLVRALAFDGLGGVFGVVADGLAGVSAALLALLVYGVFAAGPVQLVLLVAALGVWLGRVRFLVPLVLAVALALSQLRWAVGRADVLVLVVPGRLVRLVDALVALFGPGARAVVEWSWFVFRSLLVLVVVLPLVVVVVAFVLRVWVLRCLVGRVGGVGV
ncbi:hypothetical protein [Paraburkholderia steynii]|uniref:hypothetical protein n=1 Tax=Paraburkholderia steynii TaxID=1245441 RepID=UPI001422F1E6|nr:hypothetical protein [Paraburkholderia steynii]